MSDQRQPTDERSTGSGSSRVLGEQECWDLLDTTTVGRLGFVHDGRVLIIPVNYLLHDRDVIVRTSPSGVLGTLADGSADVAFEVDYHDGTSGSGWSVLMNGAVRGLSDAESADLPQTKRVLPWAGGPRDLRLRFTADQISGRRVRRRRG